MQTQLYFARIVIFILMLLGTTLQGFSQNCDTSSLQIRQVRGMDTDPNIPWELAKHYVFYNPDCSPKNTLLIYLVGTYANPVINQLFPSLAANNGFHVISLKYPNDVFAYQVCASDSNIDCYKNFRQEALYGENFSSGIDIDSTNSILNRATKLITYLDQNYPNENWGQYLVGTNIMWSKVIAAGHSQGAGHAAFMGHEFTLNRVLMFSGPLEYSTYFDAVANWFSEAKITPTSSYYAFGNTNDEVANFSNMIAGWSSMGLSAFGDSTNVDINNCPYGNYRILYTPQLLNGGISVNHGSTVADEHTPIGNNNVPEFTPVWKYMLGICEATTSLDENQNPIVARIYPNPVSGKIVFKFNQTDKNQAVLKIHDYIGSIVLRFEKLSENELIVETSEMKPGVYFYTITDVKTLKKTSGSFIKLK